MTHRRVAALLSLAAEQHGLVRAAQLESVGINRSALSRLTKQGVLEPIGGLGIRRIAGGPPTPHQLLLAAVWSAGPGGVASHRSAAWLWNLEPISQLILDVSVPPNCRRRPRGVVLHYASDVASRYVTTVDGIAVTEPTMTLFDLASVVSPDDLECAFDAALRQGLTTHRRAEAILRRVGGRGRKGTGAFRTLIDSRVGSDGVTDSMFETRLVQVLRRAGLPEPVRQFEIYDGGGFVGRFDCVYPEARVAIEADSVRHHHSRVRFESDRERRSRAEGVGWRVPTFTWRQLTRRPGWVASTVDAILDHSGWAWREAA